MTFLQARLVCGPLVLLSSLVPRAASACGPYNVAFSPQPVPAMGSLVPASLPAVAIYPGPFNSPYLTCPGPTVALLDDQSSVVATTPSPTQVGVNLLVQPLESGKSYTVKGDCDGGGAQSTFSVAPPAPLPTVTGNLHILEQGVGSVYWYNYGCGWPLSGAWARVRLTPSCELVPFLPITRFTAKVDGKEWVTTRYGSTMAEQAPYDSKTAELLVATCESATTEVHELSITAQVLGASAPAISAKVTLVAACGAEPGPMQSPGTDSVLDLDVPCYDPDAAVPSNDADTADADASNSPDASAFDASDGSDAPDSRGDAASGAESGEASVTESVQTSKVSAYGGCALRPSTRPQSAWLMLVVAFATLGRRAARRGEPRRRLRAVPPQP